MLETLAVLERYYGRYLHDLRSPLTASVAGGHRMKPEYVLYVCRQMIRHNGDTRLALLFLAELQHHRGGCDIVPLKRHKWRRNL